MSTLTVAPQQVVPDRRRRLLILVICSMSLLIVGLDVTIVNVALPAIQSSFDSTLPGLQWTVDAYTLALASLLMLAGSTADRLGRRRVFGAGLALFSLGSLLCALAPSLELLVAFRVLQAIGGAMLSPVALSIVRNVFEDPRERAQAIGVFAAMFGISMALGPVLGGVLVSGISWRAIFLVNLPVALAAIALTALFVPESRAPRPRRVDPVGQILVIAALATLTYGIIEGGRVGFGAVRIVVVLALALGCFVALVLYELRRREPLLEVRFFTSAPFAGASAIAVCLSAALGGFLFMNTLYLQDVRGLSPLHAGLHMLPTATMMIVFAPALRAPGRALRRPPVDGGRRPGGTGQRPDADRPRPGHLGAVPAQRLCGVRLRVRAGQPADRQHGGIRDAPGAGGGGRGGGHDQPPSGNHAGRGRARRRGGSQPGRRDRARVCARTRPGWWIVAALGLAVTALGYLTTTGWARDTARRTAERSRAPNRRRSN